MARASNFFSDRPGVIYVADNICLAAQFGSDTSSGLWAGMQGVCEPLGCDLLAVVGDRRESGFVSVSHDLIEADTADGFLAWRTRTGPETDTYFGRFTQKPLIYLSTSYSPHPVVSLPNKPGITALISHLVEVHNCRRIAFIGGPAKHRYAIERLQGYTETLAEKGIAFDARRVCSDGAWNQETGAEGVAILLDERGLQIGTDIDAIVCASDQIAIGALAELTRRGINVPRQLALTGFNNIRESRTHFPSLTTVSMPFQQQSRQAMTRLVTLLGLVPPFGEMPEMLPQMVVGESCGCGNQSLVRLYSNNVAVLGRYPEIIQEDDREDLTDMLTNHLHQTLLYPDAKIAAEQIVSALKSTLAGDSPDTLLRLIVPHIRTGYFGLMDQVFWQQMFGRCRVLLHTLCADPLRWSSADRIIENIRETVAEHYSREQGTLSVWENKVSDVLRVLGMELGLVPDLPAMMDLLVKDCQRLDIDSCWLVCYDVLPQGRAPEQARLLLAMEQGQRYDVPEGGVSFTSHQLLPVGYRRNAEAGTFVLMPIMHGKNEYGYVIFNQSRSTNYYETLGASIGSALRSLHLRDELAGRTRQLELSYQDLLNAQRRLVEADKMAALGELVAGVAHEINTPVGVGVTAASTLMDESSRLLEAIERREGRNLPGMAGHIHECADVVLRNLERAAQLIESFKLIAVDQTRAEVRTINLASYLQDVMRSLMPKLRPGGHMVEVECPAEIEVTCDPSIVIRIITNLVMNSLLHGFESTRNGKIQLHCWQTPAEWGIEYRDDGCGMDEKVLEKMFHPFFTTKRGRGGTGLGMHIVYNLVTQGLNGRIQCESALGKGVLFRIVAPQNPAVSRAGDAV